MSAEQDSKPSSYSLGDKVIARWADGKRYPGQIHQVLSIDSYVVLFEDGLQRAVKVNHIEPNLNPIPKTELPFDDPRLQREIHESDICDLILNCSCGSDLDNGFLVQCEHCLTWHHAACLDIQTDADLYEAITCSPCLNPKGVRKSCRYKFDHSWLKDATLPSFMASKDEQIQANDRIAAVNYLLESTLECVSVLHGLRAKIPLKNKKIDDSKELKCWSKSWLTTDFTKLRVNITTNTLNMNTITPSKVKSKSTKKAKSKKEKKKLSQSGIDLDDTDPCSVSNVEDLNLSATKTSELDTTRDDELKDHDNSMDKNKSLSINGSLSKSSDNLNQECQKHLDEHIEDIKSRLEARLEFIESRLDELEEWYGPDLDHNDIETNRTEFRVTLKSLYSDLATFKKIQLLIKELYSNTFD